MLDGIKCAQGSARNLLTHLTLDKTADIFQTFSNALMKSFVFWFEFYRRLFLRV